MRQFEVPALAFRNERRRWFGEGQGRISRVVPNSAMQRIHLGEGVHSVRAVIALSVSAGFASIAAVHGDAIRADWAVDRVAGTMRVAANKSSEGARMA